MANTVSLLSYANTFGDWVVTTNSLVKENNDLASNTYVKSVGTLYLNDPTLGLQVANTAILAGPVQIQGIGSSVYVQNTVQIDKQLTLSNTAQSLIAAGQANVGGTIFATATGTGISVSNNAIINGTTTLNNKVTINANTNIANTLFVSGRANLLSDIFVTGNTSVGQNLSVVGSISANNLSLTNITASDTVFANNVQSNIRVNTATLTVTGTSLTNNLQANTRVNTPILTVTDTAYANTLQANNSINTSTISVSTTTFTNNLQANTRVNTPTLTVTGTVYANVIQANTAANVSSITASNDVFTKNIQANNVVQTQTLNVIGTEYVNTIIANTAISTPQATVTNFLYANNAAGFFSSIQTSGQFIVGGNFVLQGATTYSSNTFTLNANSSTGSTSTYGVNRGTSGVNAVIRWNESSKYWDILNVDSNNYFKILTSDLLSSSLTLNSSANVATSAAANTLNSNINTANTWLQANDFITLSAATSYTDLANTQLKAYTDGIVVLANTQLKAYTDGAIDSANTQLKAYVDGVNSGLNTRLVAANNSALSAWTRANTSANVFVGTSGSASPTLGSISLTSTNGVTLVGSSNTITVNTPQDIRSSASPTFNGLSLTNALTINQGGTGATSQTQALTNLLPAGAVSGYVLTTGGSGTYYWAAGGGGGGGSTPGTTINSTRLFPTVNAGQTLFTTPTYTPGSSQLRVYINGVRQFNSEYTETSNTSVTLSSGCTSGDVVLLEVDGYINNPYYANNITFTAPQGSIPGSANTIQLAINDLESRKATLASPALTGVPTAPTAANTFTSNTQIATTAFVNNLANSGVTFAHSITGTSTNITAYTINQNLGTSSSVQFASTQLSSLGVGTSASGTSGEIRATDNITAYYSSDRRLKDNIINIENPLQKVSQINGVMFDWSNEEIEKRGGEDGYFVRKHDTGVIAQEIVEIMPEIVVTRENGYMAVQYEKLVPLLIEAIKELKNEVEELKKR